MGAWRITIPDLAKELGLSVGTVSNALSGRGRVAEPTRQRVLEAAQALGYTRNHAAAALRNGRYGRVGLHLPATTTDLTFYLEFTFALGATLADEGVDLVVAPPNGGRSTPLVDGMVVVDWSSADSERAATMPPTVPVLAVEGVVDERLAPTLTIAVDYERRIREIVNGALASGASAPALVTCELRPETDTAWLRGVTEGYSSACRERGLPIQHHMFRTDGSLADLATLLDGIQAQSPSDCLVFGSQRVAGLAAAVRGYGRPDSAVPWLASSVADPISELHSDAITALDSDSKAYGHRCGELILDLLAGRLERSSDRHLEWPAKITWAPHWTPAADPPGRSPRGGTDRARPAS